MQATKTRQERLKWNKSQLIDTNTYIKVYTETLCRLFAPAERHRLYMISKLFTDGVSEAERDRYESSTHFFARGEAYLEKIPDESALLKLLILNIYDRSKSYYHYRTGDIGQAMRLIYNTLRNNSVLEKEGFPFLIFDRVSQYHNLSKLYFSLQERDKALEILRQMVNFLALGESSLLEGADSDYLFSQEAYILEIRYSLLCQLLFETSGQLLKTAEGPGNRPAGGAADGLSTGGGFNAESKTFFSALLRPSGTLNFPAAMADPLVNWLKVLTLFYTGDIAAFCESAEVYLQKGGSFYRNIPQDQMRLFLERGQTLMHSIEDRH